MSYYIRAVFIETVDENGSNGTRYIWKVGEDKLSGIKLNGAVYNSGDWLMEDSSDNGGFHVEGFINYCDFETGSTGKLHKWDILTEEEAFLELL